MYNRLKSISKILFFTHLFSFKYLLNNGVETSYFESRINTIKKKLKKEHNPSPLFLFNDARMLKTRDNSIEAVSVTSKKLKNI